jgi:hypothetical protein
MLSAEGFWVSGETCEIVGKYCSRCCGGTMEKKFVVGDIFPQCGRCGKKLKWRRALADTLPIDTIETGVSGSKHGK